MGYTFGGVLSAGAGGVFIEFTADAAMGMHPRTAMIMFGVAMILFVFAYSLIERDSRRR